MQNTHNQLAAGKGTDLPIKVNNKRRVLTNVLKSGIPALVLLGIGFALGQYYQTRQDTKGQAGMSDAASEMLKSLESSKKSQTRPITDSLYTSDASKLQEIVSTLEGKIKNPDEATFNNYYQLAIAYYRLDKQAESQRYAENALNVSLSENDKKFYMTYLQNMQTIKDGKTLIWLPKASR